MWQEAGSSMFVRTNNILTDALQTRANDETSKPGALWASLWRTDCFLSKWLPCWRTRPWNCRHGNSRHTQQNLLANLPEGSLVMWGCAMCCGSAFTSPRPLTELLPNILLSYGGQDSGTEVKQIKAHWVNWISPGYFYNRDTATHEILTRSEGNTVWLWVVLSKLYPWSPT